MIYIFIREQRRLSLLLTLIVWSTWTWNSHQKSSFWIHECGSVMNSHSFRYKNTNKSLRTCVLYDWTGQRVPFLILCFIRNLRYTESRFIPTFRFIIKSSLLKWLCTSRVYAREPPSTTLDLILWIDFPSHFCSHNFYLSFLTCSRPRQTFFLHAFSFECTSKLCISFLN